MEPAAKWCSFLNNLTEELESHAASTGIFCDFVLTLFLYLKSLTLEGWEKNGLIYEYR